MSLWCDCLDCGGSGGAFICENGLLRAQLMAAKSKQDAQTLSAALVFMGIFLIALMGAGAMSSASPNPQPDAQQAAKEFTARMTDDF